MLTNVGAAKEMLKLIGAVNVVVMLQDRQPQSLAKTARPDQEDKVRLCFQQGNEARLIDIVRIVAAHPAKVGGAVRNALGNDFAHGCILA